MVFMGLCFVGPVGLVGPLVGLARGSGLAGGHGSGGFCWLLIAKSPTLGGPTCQGVLGLVKRNHDNLKCHFLISLL